MYDTRQEELEARFKTWSRLPRIFLLLILLSSIAFASKDIASSPAQIHQGKLYENLSLVDGSGFADEKLDAKTYRVYSDSSKNSQVFDFQVQNQISNNHLLDCSVFSQTCDFVVSIKPNGKNLKLNKDIFSGGAQSGAASVSKIFFYQNYTYGYTETIFQNRTAYTENGTAYTETYANGTREVQATALIEQTDLSQLLVDDGGEADIVIRFSRPGVGAVDIFPSVFGKEYKDWAWWDGLACSANSSLEFVNKTSISADFGWIDHGADEHGKNGFKFIANTNFTITSIIVNATNGANYCYVLDSSKNQLINATISTIGGWGRCMLQYNLTAGTTYYVAVDLNGNSAATFQSYYFWKTGGLVFPYVFTDFNITGGLYQGADNGGNIMAVWGINETILQSCPPSPINATLVNPANNSVFNTSTTSIRFKFNCSGANSSYLGNISINGSLNASAIPAANDSITQYIINFSTNVNTSITYSANVVCYNGTDSATSTTNIFSITNFAPNLTAVWVVNNATLFRGNTLLQGALTFNHPDDPTADIYYSWYKNGVNQTALAGSYLNAPEGTIYINTTAPPMAAGDTWSFHVIASDKINQTSMNSTNASVMNISTTSAYNATTGDLKFIPISGSSTPNASITDMNATIYWNGVAQTTAKTTGGGTFTFSALAAPSLVSGNTIIPIVIAYNATNGTDLFQFNETFNQTIIQGGVFLCNTTINTSSANISIKDELTGASINATIVIQTSLNYANSRTIINSNTTTSLPLCISPSFENYSGASNSITASATGYTTRTFSVAENYTNASQNLTFYLMNSSAGGYYVFTIVNQFNLPIPSAVITAMKFDSITGTYVLVESETTNPDGTATLFLQFNTPHNISISAAGYQNYSFSFTPASIASVRIKMTPVSGFTPAVPNYDHVFNDVQFSLQPSNSYSFNSSFNITFSVSSNHSLLQYFAMTITYSYNGTSVVVFSQNNTSSPSGGQFVYTATQNGTYSVSFAFKAQNYSDFAPGMPTFYTLNQMTGLAYTRSQFRAGGIISGWGFYFLGLFLTMLIGGWVSRYTFEAAALVGLCFLWAWTYLWPEALIAGGIQAWMATTLATIGVLGAMISKSFI